jgi:hypothetical protein
VKCKSPHVDELLVDSKKSTRSFSGNLPGRTSERSFESLGLSAIGRLVKLVEGGETDESRALLLALLSQLPP